MKRLMLILLTVAGLGGVNYRVQPLTDEETSAVKAMRAKRKAKQDAYYLADYDMRLLEWTLMSQYKFSHLGDKPDMGGLSANSVACWGTEPCRYVRTPEISEDARYIIQDLGRAR